MNIQQTAEKRNWKDKQTLVLVLNLLTK